MRLAQVGFFFAPVPQAPDRVECFACGTAVARWKPHSDPKTEHLRYAPNCPFLNGNYEKYRYEAARLQSFVGKWNLAEDFLAQPWRLAKSGFFYAPKAGGPDRCECFCCGIALVRWEKPDDPWREHQKHAPTCAFVRGLPTDNILLPGMVEVPAVKKKTEMEGLIEEIERLNIPYDEVLPSYFTCPITQDLIRDPIVLEDGHSYEKAAIFQWLTSHNTSPLTNKPLTTKLLFPNHNLKQQLVEFAEKLIESHKDQESNPPSTSFASVPTSSSAASSSSPSSSSPSTSISFSQDVIASAPPLASPPHFNLDLSDERWLQPILEACEELVAAHRQLAQAREEQDKLRNQAQLPQLPTAPLIDFLADDERTATTDRHEETSETAVSREQDQADRSSRTEEIQAADSSPTTEGIDMVANAQARFDAAEQKLRSIQKEVVAARSEDCLRSFLAAEQLRIRTEEEASLASARERAAEIVAEAQRTAETVAEEETNRLRETNAALIASIETLTRQKEQLEADIQAFSARATALYPSMPAASASSPLPLAASSSVPTASAPSLEDAPPSADSETASSAPVKRKSFASFFGFN